MAGGGIAIHDRHLQVHQDHIRLEGLDLLESSLTIAGFPNHVE